MHTALAEGSFRLADTYLRWRQVEELQRRYPCVHRH